MKLHCDVVQDLLPLYHDGVCTQVSRMAVEEHLKDCEFCRELLAAMDPEAIQEQELAAAKPLGDLSRLWKKGLKKAMLKGVGAMVLIFVVLLGGFLALTQWEWISIEAVGMKVTEVYQMEDGIILYKLEVPAGVWCRSFDFQREEDGSTYLIPKRSMIEFGQQQGYDSFFDNYLMLDVAENNAWAQSQGEPQMTRYYIGSPESIAQLLIWEEGMELQPAPDYLEEIYR